MSSDFEFFKRIKNERIEKDEFGNMLKKYNGSEKSWPNLTKIQMFGESHKSQQKTIIDSQKNITEFFKKNF